MTNLPHTGPALPRARRLIRACLVAAARGLLATGAALVLAVGLPGATPGVAAPDTGPDAGLDAGPDTGPDAGFATVTATYGDPATARRIAVLVPGSDTTAANFSTGLGGVRRRAPAWQARQLQAAAGPGTAVIAWLGYDTPEGVGRAAIRSERAIEGARMLLRFVRALSTSYPQATVVLIGHSYGTVVLGRAATNLPPAVTDLVALGSPGMDVSRAGALHSRARVWAGSARDDWTRHLPDLRLFGAGHGTNPTRPGFGALPLDVGGAAGHDGYFVPGTRSLASIAAVLAAPPVAAPPVAAPPVAAPPVAAPPVATRAVGMQVLAVAR